LSNHRVHVVQHNAGTIVVAEDWRKNWYKLLQAQIKLLKVFKGQLKWLPTFLQLLPAITSPT
jgi:hypothetical protein